ncbi:MAG: hypothetical protein V7719_16975 [Psychroserpens sp.]|uniref:hypothetical protein n=1 Tax=Psychroserpens sp. TaxID=2020870 RepID=UPI003001BF3E
MKRFILIIILSVNYLGFCQEGYVNEDGTVSDKAKRELMVGVFNENATEGTHYEIEDKYFVVITKSDCGDKKFEPEEMQNKALLSSFAQLLNQISGFKRYGYDNYSDIGFEGMIFKTNTVCMYTTRRYHFKFELDELKGFPEYMDIGELRDYVIIENKNKNIIYVKNPKK